MICLFNCNSMLNPSSLLVLCRTARGFTNKQLNHDCNQSQKLKFVM
jgi:hypothetical protein